VKQTEKYPSAPFKRFVDKLLPEKYSENLLRTAMVFLRCAESAAQQRPLGELSQGIQKIIHSNKSKGGKIEAIANHLDNHKKIGLADEIANYSLISFQDTQKFFEIYAEDFINQYLSQRKLSKKKSETFYELAYRNLAFGYLYKLAEEFVEKHPDPYASNSLPN
jgi:hypothetical protein